MFLLYLLVCPIRCAGSAQRMGSRLRNICDPTVFACSGFRRLNLPMDRFFDGLRTQSQFSRQRLLARHANRLVFPIRIDEITMPTLLASSHHRAFGIFKSQWEHVRRGSTCIAISTCTNSALFQLETIAFAFRIPRFQPCEFVVHVRYVSIAHQTVSITSYYSCPPGTKKHVVTSLAHTGHDRILLRLSASRHRFEKEKK